LCGVKSHCRFIIPLAKPEAERVRGKGKILTTTITTIMKPSSVETLPVELLQIIVRNVGPEDLRQLRCVNSAFKILATPEVFKNIVVRNTSRSANNLRELLHIPHLALHIRSITFFENHKTWDNQRIFRFATWVPRRGYIRAIFDIVHLAPALNTLTLSFNPFPCDYVYCNRELTDICSHQWDIIEASGGNRNPLPKLESLTIRNWITTCEPQFNSLYQSPPVPLLAASLLHLEFTFPQFTTSVSSLRRSLDQRMLFWKEVVETLLKPVVKLESLRIIGFEGFCVHLQEQCFDLSQMSRLTKRESSSRPQLRISSCAMQRH